MDTMKEIESTNSLEGAEIFPPKDTAEEHPLEMLLRNPRLGLTIPCSCEQIQASLSVVLGGPPVTGNIEREDLLMRVLLERAWIQNTKQLCSRLNIQYRGQASSHDSISMWAEIGLSLAKERPEFTQPRRPGRPRKRAFETRPVLLAKFFDKMQKVARASGHNLSNRELANLMKEEGFEEVPTTTTIETVLQQVSRGRRFIAN
jgi:hypothetical protein